MMAVYTTCFLCPRTRLSRLGHLIPRAPSALRSGGPGPKASGFRVLTGWKRGEPWVASPRAERWAGQVGPLSLLGVTLVVVTFGYLNTRNLHSIWEEDLKRKSEIRRTHRALIVCLRAALAGEEVGPPGEDADPIRPVAGTRCRTPRSKSEPQVTLFGVRAFMGPLAG